MSKSNPVIIAIIAIIEKLELLKNENKSVILFLLGFHPKIVYILALTYHNR